MTEPTAYKIDPEKLAQAPQRIWPYFFGGLSFTEEFEYYEVVKPYLDIPEKPKTLGEIQQEFEERVDGLVEVFRMYSRRSRESAEQRHNRRFDRIIQDFEYAKEHGKFMPKVAIGTLSGSYLVSNGGGTGLSAGSCQASFVIKQGDGNPGYYTMGNRKYFKYYMPYKPNAVVRFFMRTCLGLFWMDEE